MQASSPLHFGDTTRMDIENKICDEHGPRVDSYDTAQKQAYDRMNEVSSFVAPAAPCRRAGSGSLLFIAADLLLAIGYVIMINYAKLWVILTVQT